jgi:hypothetical protein
VRVRVERHRQRATRLARHLDHGQTLRDQQRAEEKVWRRSYGRMLGVPTVAASGPNICHRQFAQS